MGAHCLSWARIVGAGRAGCGSPAGWPAFRRRGAGQDPSFGPCERLDFELEMGFLPRGRQPARHADPPSLKASQEIVGFSLLNDWSARDIQRWEMFPLGPFLSKSFATLGLTMGGDRRCAGRLSAFRSCSAPRAIRAPLPYLFDKADQG